MTICSPADSTASRQALKGIRRTRQHSKVAFTVRQNDASAVYRPTRRIHAKLKPSPVFLCAPCGEDFDLAAIIKPNAVLNCQIANHSVPIFELVNPPRFK